MQCQGVFILPIKNSQNSVYPTPARGAGWTAGRGRWLQLSSAANAALCLSRRSCGRERVGSDLHRRLVEQLGQLAVKAITTAPRCQSGIADDAKTCGAKQQDQHRVSCLNGVGCGR